MVVSIKTPQEISAFSFREKESCGMMTIGASCEISVADFPWRAEETLQALVS